MFLLLTLFVNIVWNTINIQQVLSLQEKYHLYITSFQLIGILQLTNWELNPFLRKTRSLLNSEEKNHRNKVANRLWLRELALFSRNHRFSPFWLSWSIHKMLVAWSTFNIDVNLDSFNYYFFYRLRSPMVDSNLDANYSNVFFGIHFHHSGLDIGKGSLLIRCIL